MSTDKSLDAESMPDAFTTGYSTKKIAVSIALALAFHGALLGAYVVFGHSKSSEKAAVKAPEKEQPKADAKGAAKSDPSKSDGDVKPAQPGESAKNSEVSKPGDIPKAPDGDIDDIFKSK